MRNHTSVALFLFILLGIVLIPSHTTYAASAKEIDIETDAALERFKKEVSGASAFLDSAKGALVFPSVVKAGFGIGGEHGEGAFRIEGKTVDYYSTVAASIGFQLGIQSKAVFLLFLEKKALSEFRQSKG